MFLTHHLSYVQVVKELQVSLFQTIILLLFNDQIEWSFKDLADATNIGER
jgi:hypothetical protein